MKLNRLIQSESAPYEDPREESKSVERADSRGRVVSDTDSDSSNEGRGFQISQALNLSPKKQFDLKQFASKSNNLNYQAGAT